MRIIAHCLIAFSVQLLCSCGRYQDAKAFEEYQAHYLQAQRAYCSTNILLAEQGLLGFRSWITQRDENRKPRFNYDLNLLQVNGRLFLLYEFQGQTNQADYYYEEGAAAYARFLRSQEAPEHKISKQELRDRLARQEQGLVVGWLTNGNDSHPLQGESR